MKSSFAIFRCRQGYQILCVWRRFARALVFWCFLRVCPTLWLSVRRWSRASKTKLSDTVRLFSTTVRLCEVMRLTLLVWVICGALAARFLLGWCRSY
jgi:hypothetical protein